MIFKKISTALQFPDLSQLTDRETLEYKGVWVFLKKTQRLMLGIFLPAFPKGTFDILLGKSYTGERK